MDNEQREELQEALINLQKAGDNIENSRIRYKIDDFVEEMKNTILTETKDKIMEALEGKKGCGKYYGYYKLCNKYCGLCQECKKKQK